MEKRVRKTEMPKEVIALGKSIREKIREKKLKVKNVAHDAGLDVENLRKYMNGKQEMKVSTLVRIAKAMGVSVGELL